MKFKKIKRHFLEKKYNALLKNHIVNKQPIHKRITTVGILCTEDVYSNEDLQQLISNIFEVRNTKIYCFRNFSKENESSYKHFSENDFDWKGNVTDTSLQAFLDTKFDLLITFIGQKHMYLEYVTLLSKATFKVGYAGLNEDLFDMEVKVLGTDLPPYLYEVRKYLQVLDRI